MDSATADKAMNLVRELAEKMGTTAEHLWPKLVMAERVDAFAAIATGILLAVTGLLMVRLGRKLLKSDDMDLIAMIMVVLGFVFLFAGPIISLCCISNAVVPEAAVIKSLISALK